MRPAFAILRFVIIGVGLIAAGAAAAAPCAVKTGSGFATFYSYVAGTGACSFGDDSATPVAAANPVDYAGSELCGSWVEVTGPLGSAVVRVVDLCPSCAAGDLDLDATAFASIANPAAGRVPITWHTIEDPLEENVFVQIRPGSNAFFLQVQPFATRYGVASVEYLAAGGYVTARRESYNYFTIDGSITPTPLASPFTLRVTDVNGQAMAIPGIPLSGGHLHPAGQQFPACDLLAAPAPGTPRAVALRTPWPNPLRRSTALEFALARDGDVSLRLYDAGGRRVRTLVSGALPAGTHRAVWDGLDDAGRRLPSGLYFCRLASGGDVDQRRVVLAD